MTINMVVFISCQILLCNQNPTGLIVFLNGEMSIYKIQKIRSLQEFEIKNMRPQNIFYPPFLFFS